MKYKLIIQEEREGQEEMTFMETVHVIETDNKDTFGDILRVIADSYVEDELSKQTQTTKTRTEFRHDSTVGMNP